MSGMLEQDVVLKLNPGVALVCTKVEPEKVTKSCLSEPLARFRTEPWFKPKIGSIIPAKRRSMKRMMFDQMACSIAHVFCPRPLVYQGRLAAIYILTAVVRLSVFCSPSCCRWFVFD